jgi:hypothetical protein
MGDQSVARPLFISFTQENTQPVNKHTQTSMPPVGFEPMVPEFELTKAVHASDRSATLIGTFYLLLNSIVEFEVLIELVMKSSVFWDKMLCGPLRAHRRFGGICCLILRSKYILTRY